MPGQAYIQGLGGASQVPGGSVGGNGGGSGNGNGNGGSAQPSKLIEPKYKGIVSTFRTILKEEGWRAFYAGMGTNMMRAVPAATVTMLTYEYCMRQLNTARVQGRQRVAAFGQEGR